MKICPLLKKHCLEKSCMWYTYSIDHGFSCAIVVLGDDK